MAPTSKLSAIAAFAGMCVALCLAAQPAAAHVTVSSTDAVRGGFAVVTFHVPTESNKASTTKLTVGMPTDHPLAFVSVEPRPGWSYTLKMTRLKHPVEAEGSRISRVVSQVTWTATSRASAIHPGEFEQFNLSVGPLPDVTSLSFPALQTYSDGTVVRWVEQAAPGSNKEPDHPAPTLELASSSGSSATATSPESDDDSNVGTILGGIGIALGGAALALTLRRRSAA
jgi:periplasmic copper chaperone A